MLFPIGDDNDDRKLFPFINYLIIAANILVFVLLQDFGENQKFTYTFATVPQEILTGEDVVTENKIVEDPVSGDKFEIPGLKKTPVSVYITLITSMFMHGGFAHIFGNMVFLFVFGDNIEDRIGHFRYLIFYLLLGVLSDLAHVYATAELGGNLLIPTIGASGAISGVLGAYILLFPKKRIRVIIFWLITDVPAVFALGLWFAYQIIGGLIGVGAGADTGGIAYGAHVGGFIAGFILIKFFEIGK